MKNPLVPSGSLMYWQEPQPSGLGVVVVVVGGGQSVSEAGSLQNSGEGTHMYPPPLQETWQ